MNAGSAKKIIRERARAAVAALSAAQKQMFATRAATLLERQAVWKTASSILFFAPLADELDIWPLFEDSIQAGKRVYLPRHCAGEPSGPVAGSPGHYVACEVRDPRKELSPGKFGIREPSDCCPASPLNHLDFVLVPGIAFDLHGRRLGRGKGFYDRLLAEVRGKTCGVAFDEQMVPEIPIEPHDIPVHCILTPTRWLEF